ncbi:MAG: transporter related [Acidobacteria bacterium]|nr:transporter related [Acidobacteriota bacterium]
MPPGPPPIAIEGLTKHYGRVRALSDLSLEVREGEVFGFLGLNGAGKTTTIRLLLDLIRPTSGRARVFGCDCRARSIEARRLVGYLPGEPPFFADMTGERVLALLEAVGGRRVDAAWRGDLLERFDLPHAHLARRIRDYSTGMKRKLALVQAFQHDPPLLILDEPTESLDPLMQEALYALLADLAARGRTVFLSSHVLSEVERVCGRVAVLREGRVALLGSIADLRALAPRRVAVRFASAAPEVPASLPPAFTVLSAGPASWEVEVRGPLGPLLAAASAAPIADLEVHEPRLEEIVVPYYRGET